MHTHDFEPILAPYRKIVDEHVRPKLVFYQQRVGWRQRAARGTGVIILVISLAIPVVAHLKALPFAGLPREMVVSVLSLTIALVTGLNELFQWQRSWTEYSRRIVQIDMLIGLWEVEVAGARRLDHRDAVEQALAEATGRLLKGVEQAVSTEMDAFFAGLATARQAN